MNQDILYPYADAAGEVVYIDNAKKEQQFVCLGCNQAMRPVQGKDRVWHFRHLPDAEKCDPDSTLHQMAQRIVVQSFKSAVDTRQEYRLTLMCSSCGETAMDHNVASPDATIAAEDASLIAGIRPDLVIREADGRVTILEIVVSHDLEDETRASYKASGIPVLSKSFKEFDDLKGLESIFAADSSLNVLDSSGKWCEKCEAAFERRKRIVDQAKEFDDLNFERRKRIVDQAVAQMKSRPSTTPLFKTWRTTYQKKSMEKAKILSEFGFQQSMKNPAKFGFLIHRCRGKSIHLSAKVDFLWSVVPLVHGLDHTREPDRRICRYIINTIGKYLASEGIDGIEQYCHYADNAQLSAYIMTALPFE